ncbi:hypothetical protein RNZ50_16515 [Paracoccaceae bacterium Fryx2]|nr:hypothetical protein [Paracoccaceae bacterium Fryx2]
MRAICPADGDTRGRRRAAEPAALGWDCTARNGRAMGNDAPTGDRKGGQATIPEMSPGGGGQGRHARALAGVSLRQTVINVPRVLITAARVRLACGPSPAVPPCVCGQL